jgi:hypothetical protein
LPAELLAGRPEVVTASGRLNGRCLSVHRTPGGPVSPHIFFQGLILLHAGEEFVLILPVALLAGAFLLISWAGKRDPADPTADEDEQNVADEAEQGNHQ